MFSNFCLWSCTLEQATEDTSEPDQTEESEYSPEVEPTSEAQDEVASDEAQDGSQQENQSKNTFKYKSSHPEDQIIGNKDNPRRTRSYFRQEESMIGLLSVIEPARVDETLSDDGWILAMQEERYQFQRNDVWDLVPKAPQKNIIGTKWVFRNKLNEQGEVTKNKARLGAQGSSQQEGIDYTEIFAPVGRALKCRKLTPRFVGPFEIVEKIGVVAYQIALPPSLSNLHDVFDVSQLRKYVFDESHVIQVDELEVKDNLTVETWPVRVEDREVKHLRGKEIVFVTVIWVRPTGKSATWESESRMKDSYPELFPSGKFSRMKILLGGESCNSPIFRYLVFN